MITLIRSLLLEKDPKYTPSLVLFSAKSLRLCGDFEWNRENLKYVIALVFLGSHHGWKNCAVEEKGNRVEE